MANLTEVEFAALAYARMRQYAIDKPFVAVNSDTIKREIYLCKKRIEANIAGGTSSLWTVGVGAVVPEAMVEPFLLCLYPSIGKYFGVEMPDTWMAGLTLLSRQVMLVIFPMYVAPP